MTRERDGLILKVIAGRLEGAQTEIGYGEPVYVGHGLRNDVVLRDPSLKGVRLKLEAGDPLARLELLEGELELLGQTASAPAELTLPPFTPLRLGETLLAFGSADAEEQWARCEAMAQARLEKASEGGEAAGKNADPWSGLAGWVAAFKREQVLGRRGAVIAGSLLVALGLVQIGGMGLSASWASDAPQHKQLAAILNQPEFASVQQAPVNSDGPINVSGFVETEGDRLRLEEALSALTLETVMDVQTGEGLAKAVEDLFRLNGVTVEAEHAGDGRVRVTGAVAEPEKLSALRKMAESDVPGLKGLAISYSRPEEPSDPLTNDPTKRVATIVGGPRGYIVTDDGSRYFVGAMLPTGHRIVRLRDGEMMVELDGARTTYKF